MVANIPPERPGSPDFIANQLRSLQEQIDAVQRQSKFPFTVSHDDPIAGSVIDVAIVPRPNGSGGAVVQVYDGAANLVLGTDIDTGYGLAQPQTQVPMYYSTPGTIFRSDGTFGSMWTGQVQQSNSCFLAQWRMTNSWAAGAASSVASYVQVVDSVTGWSWTSPIVTSSTGTGTTVQTCGPYAIQVPEASIGNFLGIDIYARLVTGTSPSAVAVTPLSMFGCGYALANQWFGGTTAGPS